MKIVIFCGGYGTRMWPASRKSLPKQFFPLFDGQSFFQTTVKRFLREFKPEDIIISTEARYSKVVFEQAPQIPVENVILEPERRDTLAAIGLVAAILSKKYPDEVLFFSWSDHLIKDETKFLAAVRECLEYTAKTGTPISLNQVPLFASIYNGWIKMGKHVPTSGTHKYYEIDKFVEKPNIHRAKRLFKSGKYLIHTGYGAWNVSDLMSYFKEFTPNAYRTLSIISEAYGSPSFPEVLSREYQNIEKNSVEYAIFEKISGDKRLTMRVDVGWQDAGTWQLLYESLADKEGENVFLGNRNVITLESENNLIVNDTKKLITLIGIQDIAIIQTNDSILITSLGKTAKVKDMFALLEKSNPEYVE